MRIRSPQSIALAVLCLFALSAPAQTTVLADIQAGNVGSNPANFVEFGGFVYFAADDPSLGRELFRSDGTAANTALFMDLNPGSAGSNPSDLAVVNGVLYFQADDGVNGAELWKTDGTPGGTVLVADIRPGLLSSSPRFMTGFNGNVYFQADDGMAGRELWVTDGTAAGTTMVMDINPGSLPIFGPNSSNPSNLTASGFLLYFTADDGANGVELWAHDGFSTFLVLDVFPGTGPPFGNANSSFPSNLIDFGGFLMFSATDGVFGTELWTSDGSPFGTFAVADINSAGSSFPAELTLIGSQLVFTADDGANGRELWSLANPFAFPSLLVDVNPGPNSSNPTGLTVSGGNLFFAADDGVNGSELWKSDGTAPGTQLVADIAAGSTSSSAASITPLAGGPNVVFVADDGPHGAEIWTSDGTAAGTLLVIDIDPCDSSSIPGDLTALGTVVIFQATAPGLGSEPWVTDGNPVPPLGTGQAPQPGMAVMDLNGALEPGGAPVCSGLPGPYAVQTSVGSLASLQFSGAAGQPIILMSGAINPGAATFPNIGQLDIGAGFDPITGLLSGITIVASGLDAGLLNQIFVTSAMGVVDLQFTTPASLAGQQIGLQAFMFNGGPTVVSLSNAIAWTIL